MRILVASIAALALSACASSNPPPRSPAPASQTQTTTTTSGEQTVSPTGYSGTTEYGLSNGPDGTPYQGNVDPGSNTSNRTPRDKKPVQQAPNAK
jgi:hypothetical protein